MSGTIFAQAFQSVPVPRDIPLPLPVDPFLLQALLVVLFLGHILFVNLMVGGSLLTVAAEIIGLRREGYDRLAREIAGTITVNKSLAVVLGVGPLLAINLLYTVYFYSANALTGTAWIMIVPLVIIAFLFTYAHKYSWDRYGDRKIRHILLGATGTLLFLFIPLIFLTNINLMLFPDRWAEVRGFFSAWTLPNVWPRYLHFLFASLAITGLFCYGYFTRSAYPVETKFPQWDRPRLRRMFYLIAFAATVLQVFAGLLVYFTLPVQGISVALVVVIVIGATCALLMLGLLWYEILFTGPKVGRFYLPIVVLLMAVGSCMGYGRHLYREEAIREHRMLMQQKTADFHWSVAAAKWRAARGIEQEDIPIGQKIYRDLCSTCHAVEQVLVGPSVTEIAGLYESNPAGIVAWTQSPGKKRENFIQMPGFPQIPEQQLQEVAEYMLALVPAPDSGPAEPTEPAEQIR